MSTAKTILIVGGVAGGAFVLYQLFKPGAPLARPSTAARRTTDGGIEAGLVGLISGIVTSTRTPAGGTATGISAGGQAATPVLSWNQDPNAGIDPATGGVKLDEGDVYGPPAPPSSGDDGLMSPTFV